MVYVSKECLPLGILGIYLGISWAYPWDGYPGYPGHILVLYPWDGLGVWDQWMYLLVPRSPSLMAQTSGPSTTSQGNR